ncbi:MAG: ATP-binding protein [Chloroflexota bacterium]
MPWQTIGQEPARRFLARSIEVGRVAHAYLLTGPANSGKTTLALDFARALICTGSPRPCDVCPECRMVLGAGHPDVEQIEGDEDEAAEFSALWKSGSGERPRRALPIVRVRELIRVMATRPSQAAYRVATLDGSMLQDTAASALLKLFEEPASRAVLLLRAPAVETVPPPITSRCQLVRLAPVPSRQIELWLKETLGVSDDDAAVYSALAGGRPGLAKRLASSGGHAPLDAQIALWLELTAADTVTRLDQAAVWSRNFPAARAALDLAVLVWHQLVQLAAAGGAASTVAGSSPLPAFQTLPAQRLRDRGVVALAAQLTLIARASRLLDANVQPRLALEWLMLEL